MKRILTVEVECEDVKVLNVYTDTIHANVRRFAELAEISKHDVAVTVTDKMA